MRIDVTGVTKTYPGVVVLDDLALSVADGARVAILGPSGSGKTTLLRLIAGLDLPDRGEIRLGEILVTGPGVDLPPHRRGVAYAAQFPALWPHMTVLDNIVFGVAGDKHAAHARATTLLEEFELGGLAGRYPDQLSGGQAKRIALARAVAPGRPVLLLDEPLTHVEPNLRDTLLASVLSYVAADEATLVYVTHDAAEAAAVSSNPLVMTDGRLSQLAPAAATAHTQKDPR